MARKRHPKKAIENAIRYAERHGWTVKDAGNSAHAWGILQCPANSPECRCGRFCKNGIWSTPRDERAHARHIRRCVVRCLFSQPAPRQTGERPGAGGAGSAGSAGKDRAAGHNAAGHKKRGAT